MTLLNGGAYEGENQIAMGSRMKRLVTTAGQSRTAEFLRGMQTCTVSRRQCRTGAESLENSESDMLAYYWQSVQDHPYIYIYIPTTTKVKVL